MDTNEYRHKHDDFDIFEYTYQQPDAKHNADIHADSFHLDNYAYIYINTN